MKKRGKALTRMIISYTVMVCIPIVIAMAVYGFTYSIVKHQANAYNNSLITMIKSSCDSEIRYYKNILENLRTEEELQQMSLKQEYHSGKDYWNDYLGQQLLANNGKNMRDSYCYDMFVWLGKQEKVVNMSSSMSYTLYTEIMCQSNALMAEKLKASMQEVRDSTVTGLRLGQKSYMVFLEPVIGIGIERGTAVLGMWVDVDAWNHQINSINWEKEMEWVLVDSQGNVIRDAERFSVLDLPGEKLLESDNRNISVGGTEYLVTAIPSDFYGLKYLLFTPESMVETPANRIRTVNFFSLVLVLVTGCLATVYFTKMHYHPLKQLLTLFGSNTGTVSNEYEYIQEHVSHIMKENRDAEKKSTSLSRLYALESLLLEKNPDSSFRDTWESLAKKFRDGKNLVLVFCEQGGFCSEEQEGYLKEDWLRRFVVSNIFAEALGEFFQEETFVYGNRVVTVLNIPKNEEAYREILQNELEAKKEFILQNFHFTFYVLEGGAYPGLSGISRSWQEACQAEAFISDLDESHIRYEEIRDMSVYNYAYSFALEESIVSAIRSGDAELAQTIIENLIDKNLSGPQEFITEMHACMLYDIYGTLVKTAEEQGCSITRFPRITAGSGMNRVAAMRESFREIIERICSATEQPAQGRQGDLLSNVIQEYVEAHYADPDLNVSQIAYHLHMTPAWVSATFKKQTGKSLLSAIKQVRIQNAKALLNEGYSVLEVTRRTGFRESTTFIKIFKSITGVTPGQWRKMNQNEN